MSLCPDPDVNLSSTEERDYRSCSSNQIPKMTQTASSRWQSGKPSDSPDSIGFPVSNVCAERKHIHATSSDRVTDPLATASDGCGGRAPAPRLARFPPQRLRQRQRGRLRPQRQLRRRQMNDLQLSPKSHFYRFNRRCEKVTFQQTVIIYAATIEVNSTTTSKNNDWLRKFGETSTRHIPLRRHDIIIIF